MTHPPDLRAELRRALRLALPAVANSLLQTLMFVVDRVMLGHHSREALAAMQTAGPIVWSLFAGVGAFAAGTVAVVGRSIGAGDARGATEGARASLVLAIGLGAVVGIGATLGVPWIVRAFDPHADPAVRAMASAYMQTVLPALPLFFVGLACVSILQCAGDTRTPLVIGLVTNGVNLLLNGALVLGWWGAPRLGATGSALSSDVAALLEAGLGLWVLLRAGSPVSLRARADVFVVRGLARVAHVATGSWGERLGYQSGYLVFAHVVADLGATSMAANQALISIESVSFLTADGFAVAAGALVAQSLGAKDPLGARRAGWLVVGLCASVLACFAVAFVAIPAPLVRLFRDDPGLVRVGASALRVGAIAQIPMALAVVLAQAMRGAGATREVLLVSLLCAVLVRVAATYGAVYGLHLGLAGVWVGSTCDWCVRAVAYTVRWRKGDWVRTRV